MTRFRKLEIDDGVPFATYRTTVDLSALTFSSGVAKVSSVATPDIPIALRVIEAELEGADATTLEVEDAHGEDIVTVTIADLPDAGVGTWVPHDVRQLRSLTRRLANAPTTSPALADGTTAGNVKVGQDFTVSIGGVLTELAASGLDDAWDLSGETNTDASSWRAYALLVTSSGADGFVAGADIADTGNAAADTRSAIAAIDEADIATTHAVVGYFIAGPSTDFDDENGLSNNATVVYTNGRALAEPTSDTTTADLVFTLTGGTDQDPTGGSVVVEVIGIDLE